MARKASAGSGPRKRQPSQATINRRIAKMRGPNATPLDELSPGYRARLEAAARRGATKMQAARGHTTRRGQTESSVRKQREEAVKEATGKLTSADRARLKRWVDYKHPLIPWQDKGEMMRKLVAFAMSEGMEKAMNEINYDRALTRRGLNGPTGVTIDQLRARYEVDRIGFPDAEWYYYGNLRTSRREFLEAA
jgi:hypothetical protein